MNLQQLLLSGDTEHALTAAREQVRNDPSASSHRVALFQLLALVGEWEKALTQLEVIEGLEPDALPMVRTYREAIRCETLRKAVFSGQRSPFLLGEPQPWIAWMIDALRLDAEGQYGEAQRLRERAFAEADASTGKLDGEGFEWIADADPRLGPLLEVIVNGRYYWLPFHQVRSIGFEAPEDLRDLVWTPAFFVWANGGEAAGLIPTRYPGSEKQSDSRLVLSRMTLWNEREEGIYFGLGQRQLCTDKGEHALMDVRLLELSISTEASSTEPGR